MKPLYITLISVALTCIINSNAVALNIGDLQPDIPIANPQCSKSTYWEICSTLTTTEYIGCSTSECLKCENSSLSSTTPNSYGVLQDSNYTYKANCEGWQSTCSCHNSTSYTCGKGYYGTATSFTSGCTACPANATCNGGNGSTFVCKAGYYKNGTSCAHCPGSEEGGAGIGETWGSSSAGATNITQCYIEAWQEICDDTGCFDFTKDCYWTN